tara:strand:- start:601 stop:2073 length:1473 start_codon:yes stop_codon:yes gene_type:complete
MATITWVAGTDTDAAKAANWDTGGVPGSGDDVVFGASATKVCAWSHTAIGQVNKIVIQAAFPHTLLFQGGTVVCASLDVSKAGTVDANSATVLAFGDGAYDFTNSYVKINSATDTSLNTSTTGMFEDAAARANMTFLMAIIGTSSSEGLKFDDGVYPNILLNAGAAAYLLPTYLAPNNTYGKVDMSSLNLTANVTASMTGVTVVENDYAKVFHIRGALTIASNSFDMGYSTVHFTGAAHPSPLSIPITGNTTYGTANLFESSIHSIVIEAGANAADYVLVPAGFTLSCNSLTIGDGANLHGPSATPGSQIILVERPKIRGSWNFQQVADGHFRSAKYTTRNAYNPHTAHISLASSVAGFTSGAYTICPLDTSDFDTAGKWDNTNRCYVAPRGGKYLVSYSAAIRYISTSQVCIAQLQKQDGGSGGFSGAAVSIGTNGRNSGDPSGGTIILNLDAGDRIALYCYHNGSSGKNLIGDAVSEGLTFLSIMEIV